MLFFKKYFSNVTFYKRTGLIMFPIAIQSIITSISSFIDTMMASQIDCISAIGTALQIDALMQGIAFGIAAGINIFIVQYFGANDYQNMKRSFGLSLISVTFNALFWIVLVFILNKQLLGIFIQNETVIANALEYIKIACFSYIFTSLVLSFTFAYHSVQKTYIPLLISIITTVLHIFFNQLFMFQLCFGIKGAAISLLLSQAISFILYLLYSIISHQPFIGSIFELFKIPFSFIKRIYIKVIPLIINETLFSVGNSLFIIAYGLLGKNVMDCYYIGNQIVNVFYTIVNAMSDASTSMIGLELGKENYNYAEKEVNYFFGMTGILSCIIIIALLLFAPQIIKLFEVQSPKQIYLAIAIIRVLSIRIAFRLFNVVIFSALRAGGDSKYLTFLDSVILWGIGLVSTFFMICLLHIDNIVIIILVSQIEQLVRLILGMKRLKTKKWLHALV